MTRRQRAILAFIALYQHLNGYPPTIREIGQAVGLSSTSSVAAQLHNLRRAGHLEWQPSLPRTLRVVAAT